MSSSDRSAVRSGRPSRDQPVLEFPRPAVADGDHAETVEQLIRTKVPLGRLELALQTSVVLLERRAPARPLGSLGLEGGQAGLPVGSLAVRGATLLLPGGLVPLPGGL